MKDFIPYLIILGLIYFLYEANNPGKTIELMESKFRIEEKILQDKIDSLQKLTDELIFEIDSAFPAFIIEERARIKIETLEELERADNAEILDILNNLRKRLQSN